MVKEKKAKSRFMGTYFDPNIIFRISGFSRVLAWVVLAVYSIDFIDYFAVIILQIARGYWVGMGFTDYVSNILSLLERPFRGLVYFVVLLGISELIKVFIDIEENTRRSARNHS